VVASQSDSLVVVDVSNPASPAVRGSVVSSSLLDGVREAGSCARGWRQRAALASAPSIMLAAAAPPPAEALSRSHVLCAQARSVAVSGSYAYVAAELSDSLVVVDVSNPASPVIRGSVVSSSLLDRVRVLCARGWHRALRNASAPPIMLAAAAPPPAEALSRSRVLCAQSHFVAVSGSYAYVTAYLSDSLVVVDISNPASPAVRGSVVSSSLLDGVRVRPGALRALMASGVPRSRPHRPSCSRPRRHRLLKLSRAYLLALTCCAPRLGASL